MSQTTTAYDPGIQVVRSDIGIEVDGRGVQHQPYDRNAPLEDIEAHFQANFRPDCEREEETPNNPHQETRHPNERAKAFPKRSKLLARWEGRKRPQKMILWLYFALLVLVIAASVLAERFAHLSRSTGPTGNGKPSSDCKSLQSPYTSIINTLFTLDCGSNFRLFDLMSVWVYQFEDCIHACVSFNIKHQGTGLNESCGAVSYAYTLTYGDQSASHAAGNCFLKDATPDSTGLTEKDADETVDSAFYTDVSISSGEAVERR